MDPSAHPAQRPACSIIRNNELDEKVQLLKSEVHKALGVVDPPTAHELVPVFNKGLAPGIDLPDDVPQLGL
jgi:hypothetical protein